MGKIYKFLGRLFSNDYITAGPNNEVKNNECTVIGSNLVTGGDHQTILGKYNEELNGDYCFVIGQGTSNKRKNILTLADNGNLRLAGNIEPNGYLGLPKFVIKVSVVGRDIQVLYSDGSVENHRVSQTEGEDEVVMPTSTGRVTSVYTNAQTVYYIELDDPLKENIKYNITNSPAEYWISGSMIDINQDFNMLQKHLKSDYIFYITDSKNNTYSITMNKNGSKYMYSGWDPTTKVYLVPEPEKNFSFTYANGKISWIQ